MNENLTAFPPWRKSHCLLQDPAFQPKDLIILVQACKLLGDILMRAIKQFSQPCSEHHRLNVDCATPRSLPTRSILNPFVTVSRTASYLNSSLRRLCLFQLIAASSIHHRGWLSTFAGKAHRAWHPNCMICRLSQVATIPNNHSAVKERAS